MTGHQFEFECINRKLEFTIDGKRNRTCKATGIRLVMIASKQSPQHSIVLPSVDVESSRQ